MATYGENDKDNIELMPEVCCQVHLGYEDREFKEAPQHDDARDELGLALFLSAFYCCYEY